ncbi:MAG: SH3 domain-containing protein [Flavobacteriales bacterium]|nr:SH3 domain-containing protein [Flavobacteriales bacterium]
MTKVLLFLFCALLINLSFSQQSKIDPIIRSIQKLNLKQIGYTHHYESEDEKYVNLFTDENGIIRKCQYGYPYDEVPYIQITEYFDENGDLIALYFISGEGKNLFGKLYFENSKLIDKEIFDNYGENGSIQSIDKLPIELTMISSGFSGSGYDKICYHETSTNLSVDKTLKQSIDDKNQNISIRLNPYYDSYIYKGTNCFTWKSNVILRQKSTKDSEKIMLLPLFTDFEILESSTNEVSEKWYRIKVYNPNLREYLEGWIYGEFVEKK